MTQEELLTIANEIYAANQGKTPEKPLTMEMTFDEDLGMDSLEVVEFAIDLEDRLGTKIPNDIVDGAKTVGDIIQALTIAV